jgi:hypothetical protein
MKPTQEILSSIDFDKYIDWIRDIYFGIDQDKYSKYLYSFVSRDKWNDSEGNPEKVKMLVESLNLDNSKITSLIELYEQSYYNMINEIKENQDVNRDYHKIKINECSQKDYEILGLIALKKFYPLFGTPKTHPKNDVFEFIMKDIAELKAIQYFMMEKPGKTDVFELPKQMMLLKELGFFELEYFNDGLCTVNKRNEVTALLLNANLSNVKDNYLAFTTTSPKTGKNPLIHKELIKQLLRKEK